MSGGGQWKAVWAEDAVADEKSVLLFFGCPHAVLVKGERDGIESGPKGI